MQCSLAEKQNNFRITTFSEPNQLIEWQVLASAEITMLMKPSGPIYTAKGSSSDLGLTSCKWEPSVTGKGWGKCQWSTANLSPLWKNSFKTGPADGYATAFLLLIKEGTIVQTRMNWHSSLYKSDLQKWTFKTQCVHNYLASHQFLVWWGLRQEW